jgi:hypothetical protein
VLLLALAAGCTTHWDGVGTTPTALVVGSGRFVTESRPVTAFDRVVATAGIHVHVTPAAVESIEIRAEDNVLPLIDSVVVNGTLTLGWKPGTSGVSVHGMDVTVGARQLRGVVASAGSQIALDRAASGDLTVTLSGGSGFSGSGAIGRLDLDASGGSHASAADLTCRVASAKLSGGSSAVLRVVDSLSAIVSGGSTLQYFGDPVVVQTVTDASTVRRLGP